MAVTSVIGEAGVRIRPITSGFSRELQSLIDSANKQSQSGVLPLTLSSAGAEQTLNDLIGRAERGAVLPVVALAKEAEDAVSGIKTSAEKGAALPITPEARAAETAVAELVGKAEAGAALPVTANADNARAEVDSLINRIEQGATASVQVTTDAAEQEAAALRGAFSSPILTPLSLDLDGAFEQFAKLQDVVASTPLTPNLDLQGAASGIGQIGGLAGQSGDQVGQLSGLLGGLSDQLTGLSGGLNGITGRLSPLLSRGSLLVGGGLVGGALAFGSVISAGQQRLTTIEDSVAALEIQLGGAKQAASVVADVLATVKGTPFNLDQFVSAARSLITFGVEAEKIPVYLNAIGEAAAGSGQGIEAVQRITDVFAQTTIAGRVTLDDVYRLANVGVDALTILGNSFGKTTEEIKGMISAGAVPAEKALNDIVKGINEGSTGVAGRVNKLGGSMEKLRDTFSGAAGGLQAASARLGVAFLEPFRDVSVKVLQQFTDVLDAIGPALKSMLTEVATSGAGIVQAFSDTLGKVPDFFKSLSSAFKSGGLEGLLNQLASFTGPLEDSFSSIFNNLRELASQLGPILQDLVDGATAAAAVLGGALVAALRVTLNALGELTNFLGKLAESTSVIQALGAALGALIGLNFLKRVSLLGTAFTGLNGALAKATGATAASTAATNVDTVAKERNAAATATQAAAEKGLAAARGSATASGIAAGNANLIAGLDKLDDAPQKVNRFTGALGRAGTALKGFGAAFGAEIAIALGIGLFVGTQKFLDAALEEARARGKEVAEQYVASVTTEQDGMTVRARGAALLADRTLGNLVPISTAEAINPYGDIYERLTQINDELGGTAEQLTTNVAGAFSTAYVAARDFAGQAGVVGDVLFNIVQAPLPVGPVLDYFGAWDASAEALQVDETLRAEYEQLTQFIADNAQEIIDSTANWEDYADAIKLSEGALRRLGVQRVDQTQIAQNEQQILNQLLAAEQARNQQRLAAGEETVPVDVNRAKEIAQELSAYDLPQLQAALEATGLDITDTSLSAQDFAKALEEQAAKTLSAQVEAVGLGKRLGEVAEQYAAAKKEADTFANALFVQQAAWAATLTTADQFSSSLDGIQNRTDITAGQLSSLISQAQAAASATFERVRAEAELAGSSDAVGDATKAVLTQTESLRSSFLSTAEAAGFTADEANALATAVFGIPGYAQIDIAIKVNTLELDAAEERLRNLQVEIGQSIPRDITSSNPLRFLYDPNLNQATGEVERLRRVQEELSRWDRLAKASSDQSRRDAEKLITSSRDKQAADRARQEAQRSQQEAARKAQQAADEERRRKEQELREFFQMIQNLERATDQFRGSIENVSKSLQQARDQLIGNLQQRVELGQGSSVSRLIRNATERNRLLGEVQGGVTQLQSRGLSGDALRYLGVTGRAEDARAVRRLLRASPEQLAQLSTEIGTLSDTAQRAAYREQGQIIGKEVRTAIEQWAGTPGAQQKLSVEQVLQIVSESRGDPVAIARGVTERIGGTVKR